LERLSVLRDGRVAYQVKYPRRKGTHRVMTPVAFLARLAALVPPPRYPLLRYHGVLAPHAKRRGVVVPKAPRRACEGEHAARASSAGRGDKKPAIAGAPEGHVPKELERGTQKTKRSAATKSLTFGSRFELLSPASWRWMEVHPLNASRRPTFRRVSGGGCQRVAVKRRVTRHSGGMRSYGETS
jgi:hypothetical protein